MKTTNTKFLIVTAVAIIAVLFQACKDDDNGPRELNVDTMTVGGADLNAATSPDDVPTDASIVVTFDTDIMAETATSSNITLTQDYNNEDVEVDITVDGPMLTVTPVNDLGSGTLYEFQISSGLLNLDEQSLVATSRAFTTVGTFAPSGAIAHYSFEGSAEDETGNYDPSANGVVDITYTDSYTTEAGQAAQFNGSTSIIEIPNGPALSDTDDFALSIWVRPDTNAHGGGNYVLGNGGFNGFVFELNKNDGKLAAQYEFADGNSGGEDLWIDGRGDLGWQGWTYSRDYSSQGGFSSVVQEKWTHFVFMYNSETKVGSAYINGELAKSQDFNLWPDGDAKQTVVGLAYNSQDGLGENLALGFYSDRSTTIYSWADYSNPDANHYSGLMDDVRIYHRVLTETEIQLMYASGD